MKLGLSLSILLAVYTGLSRMKRREETKQGGGFGKARTDANANMGGHQDRSGLWMLR